MIQRAKAEALRRVLNLSLFRKYGRIDSLRFDRRNQRIEASIHLKGEGLPIELEIIRYELRHEGEKSWIILHEVRASRFWMEQLANDLVRDKPFLLPERYAASIKGMLE